MASICYILSFGFPARMILHTGIVPELRKRGVKVSAICPGANEPGLRSLAERVGIELHEPTACRMRFGQEYLAVRRYLFEDVRRNPALLARHLRDIELHRNSACSMKQRISGAIRRFERRSLYALNRLMSNTRLLTSPAAAGERLFLRSQGMRQFLKRIAPDVVVSTYPIDTLEATVLAEAKRLGLTTVTQLLSWDNITSKGRFPVVTDYYLTWGSIMTQELREYYAIPKDRIFETGVAHFDAQLKLADERLRTKSLAEIGLNPAHPYLLFGMSSPFFAPHEIDIVEELARWVSGNELGPHLNLVIRPHPQNVHGHMADPTWLPRLRALQGPRIGLFWPRLTDSKLLWALDESDLPALASVMAGCAVNLNSGSTFAIDGLIHEKPVILTFFDAGHDLPWHRSARRCAEFIHLKKLIETGGLFPVHSWEQLKETLKRLLAEPSLNLEARRAALKAECGSTAGRAAERIASALAEILSDRTLNGASREFPTLHASQSVG